MIHSQERKKVEEGMKETMRKKVEWIRRDERRRLEGQIRYVEMRRAEERYDRKRQMDERMHSGEKKKRETFEDKVDKLVKAYEDERQERERQQKLDHEICRIRGELEKKNQQV